ncbi:hypothetical protein HY633_03085 [Candidatus Uhrbacteria bacterium]|nr:hypothetical protein [Candidatus Uhrbacteria bacterium]
MRSALCTPLLLCCACIMSPGSDAQYTFYFSSQEFDGGTLPVPYGEQVNVEVMVQDENGDFVLINPFLISWTAADPDILEVSSFDGHAAIKGKKDWFDVLPPGADAGAGHEPATDLIVDYRGSTGVIRVVVVINAQDTWSIRADDDPAQEVKFKQDGRTVRHEIFDYEGSIDGNAFIFSGFGYDLTGAFVNRDRTEGTYINNNKGTAGPWVGDRL